MKRKISIIFLVFLLLGCSPINSGTPLSIQTLSHTTESATFSVTNSPEPTQTSSPEPTQTASPTRQPIENYCTDDLSGTTLAGGNDFPPVPLPSDRSSLVSLAEDEMAFSVCMIGFLPPEGYNIVGSPVALKLVKDINIDRRVEQDGGSRKWAINRWESTTIDVFTNNVEGANDALGYIAKALEGTIQ